MPRIEAAQTLPSARTLCWLVELELNGVKSTTFFIDMDDETVNTLSPQDHDLCRSPQRCLCQVWYDRERL